MCCQDDEISPTHYGPGVRTHFHTVLPVVGAALPQRRACWVARTSRVFRLSTTVSFACLSCMQERQTFVVCLDLNAIYVAWIKFVLSEFSKYLSHSLILHDSIYISVFLIDFFNLNFIIFFHLYLNELKICYTTLKNTLKLLSYLLVLFIFVGILWCWI